VNFLAENWILIVVAFVSGGLLVWPLVKGGSGSGAVPTTEAVRLINREKGVLIDVAEPAEFAAGHATGARNVPFGQLPNSKDLPSNKALPLLVMCPTGARGRRAAALLRKAGYDKAVAVTGGTAAWREAALPTERSVEKGAEKPDNKTSNKTAQAKDADKAREKAASKAAATKALPPA
jgi:rhodanese-related sulfurtransferase